MIQEHIQGVTFGYERYKTATKTIDCLVLETETSRIIIRDIDILLATISRMRAMPGNIV